MSITPFWVIEFLGLLELLEFVGLVELTDFGLKEPYKLNEPNKLSLAFHAKPSVKSFSLSILRFQVEIWGTT
jgi:hypothetical protein